jgi:hypothetical protein
MIEIHCRFTGEVKFPPQLRHSQKTGRIWCKLQVMVAAGSLSDVGVLCFGGRAKRVVETLGAGDMVEVKGRLSLWSRDGLTQELSVISSLIRQPSATPADVANQRGRHADAESTIGLEG